MVAGFFCWDDTQHFANVNSAVHGLQICGVFGRLTKRSTNLQGGPCLNEDGNLETWPAKGVFVLDPPGRMWTTRLRPYPPRSSTPRRSSRNHARRVFGTADFSGFLDGLPILLEKVFFRGAKGILNLIKRCWDDESWWQLPPSFHTLVHQVMGVALNGESDVQTLNTSLLVGCLGSAGKGSWHLMSLKASFLAIIFIVEDVTDLHLLFKSWMPTVSLEDLLEFCFLGVELKIGVFNPPPKIIHFFHHPFWGSIICGMILHHRHLLGLRHPSRGRSTGLPSKKEDK